MKFFFHFPPHNKTSHSLFLRSDSSLVCSQQTRDIEPMLGRRSRWRANIEPTLVQCLMFAGLCHPGPLCR